MEQIKLLLVDDHVLFREGLRSLLELQKDIQIMGEASNGHEAVSLAKRVLPDLILMDVRMPGMSGVEATKIIKTELPQIQIVMLTVSDEDNDLFGAIKAGAQGYILKNTPSAELVRQLRGVMAGESPISGHMASKILVEFSSGTVSRDTGANESLTDREEEVLCLIGQGATNKEISKTLMITESTVKKHVRNILDKLHLRNRVEAALYIKEKTNR